MRLLEVHLEVADPQASLKVYSALIPHAKIDRWDEDTAIALILENGAAFGLWKTGKAGIHGGRGGKHVHFAFQIRPDEYDACKALIVAAGLKPLEHVWPNGGRSVYFFDADGHQGEFMTVDWLGSDTTS